MCGTGLHDVIIHDPINGGGIVQLPSKCFKNSAPTNLLTWLDVDKVGVTAKIVVPGYMRACTSVQ